MEANVRLLDTLEATDAPDREALSNLVARKTLVAILMILTLLWRWNLINEWKLVKVLKCLYVGQRGF